MELLWKLFIPLTCLNSVKFSTDILQSSFKKYATYHIAFSELQHEHTAIINCIVHRHAVQGQR